MNTTTYDPKDDKATFDALMQRVIAGGATLNQAQRDSIAEDGKAVLSVINASSPNQLLVKTALNTFDRPHRRERALAVPPYRFR